MPADPTSVADYTLAKCGLDTISDPTSHLTSEGLQVTPWPLLGGGPERPLLVDSRVVRPLPGALLYIQGREHVQLRPETEHPIRQRRRSDVGRTAEKRP